METTTARNPRGGQRYDRTLRVVMWLDAFWSVAAVAAAVLAGAFAWLLHVPPGARMGVGVAAVAAAAFLAATGVVTGVLLMLRLNAGVYTMPRDMRVPLPRGMHPEIGVE